MASLFLAFLPVDSLFGLLSTLFATLILSGVGVPIPEEVVLLLGGYLSYLGFITYWQAIITLFFGIICADMLGFIMGKYGGEWLWKNIFGKWPFACRLMEKAEEQFKNRGEKVIIYSRPIAGLRVAVPILAGHFRVPFKKFILYDTVGALPWTFFLVTLSYFLGTGLDLITDVRAIKHYVFIGLGAAIFLYAAIKIINNNFSVSSEN